MQNATPLMHIMCAALLSVLATSAALAQSKPSCGMNNGKKAVGEPIAIGSYLLRVLV